MKILYVIPFFPPAYAFGGGPRSAFVQARELVKRGHEVTVYTTDARDQYSRIFHGNAAWVEKYISGIRVIYFKNLSLLTVRIFSLFITPTLKAFAEYEVKEFDIIHLHGFRSFQNIIVTQIAQKYNVPYLLQARGTIPRTGPLKTIKALYDIAFGYKLLREASRVIALTSEEAKEYQSIGVPREKIAIIPNGVDLSEYAELPPRGYFRKKFGIPEDKKIILYMGRIHYVKGIDILIKAYAYLLNHLGYKDIVLVVAGPDDGYLKEAKSLAISTGVSKSVIFTGPLYGKDRLSAYVDSDILVLPSRHEGFPRVILEAWACGKPVIASQTKGLMELITEGENGFLFEPENYRQLAEQLSYLLNDSTKASELGKKGKALVENKYSIDKVINQLERIYYDVVKAKKS